MTRVVATRRTAGIVLAVMISAGILHPATAQDSPFPTTGRAAAAPTPQIEINVNQRGERIHHIGFDVKQYSGNPKALTETLARQIFSTGDYDVLRVPITPQPNGTEPWQRYVSADLSLPDNDPDADGRQTYVDPYVRFAEWAQEAAPDGVTVKVFASLKTNEHNGKDADRRNDCLSWGQFGESHAACKAFSPYLHVGDDPAGRVDGAEYARYLVNYLKEWQARGVGVDMLGVDNEGAGFNGGAEPLAGWPNNDGQISAAKFDTIVGGLVDGLGAAGVPKIVFNDAKYPDTSTICGAGSGAGLSNAGWSQVDYLAFHYGGHKVLVNRGPDHQPVRVYIDRLKDCETSHDPSGAKHTWDTEFHFGDKSQPEYTAASRSVRALFDELSVGVNGLVWWGKPQTTGTPCTDIGSSPIESGRIMATLSTALRGAVPLRYTRTGTDNVWFQSVKNGRALWLVVVADAGATPDDLLVRAQGKVISPPSHPGYRVYRWRALANGELGDQYCPRSQVQAVQGHPSMLRLANLPDRSITIVRIPEVFEN